MCPINSGVGSVLIMLVLETHQCVLLNVIAHLLNGYILSRWPLPQEWISCHQEFKVGDLLAQQSQWQGSTFFLLAPSEA